MRFRTLVFLIALLLHLPTQSQDAEFPTLEALANLDIPAFDYAEMVGRMSSTNPNHVPPANPPHYEIGDQEWFNLVFGQDLDIESKRMELRGSTERVLIWIQLSVDYPRWRAQALAQRLETHVLDPMQRLFRFSEPPGVDGDPRLYVIFINDPDGASLGYFLQWSTRPKRLDSESNQHEMLVVNLAEDDEYTFFDKVLIEVVAHEYLHILLFHSDFGEESWLDEALASYAGYVAAKPLLRIQGAHGMADSFLEAPNISLTQWQAVEDRLPKYGAAVLFMIFLAERFGEDLMAPLLADKANGWRAVDKVLREHAGIAAVDVFADWVLANYFLDSRRGYGYKALEADLTPPQPVASYNSFPATHDGYLPQYSTDYVAVDVRGADKLYLRLWQDPEARLIDEAPVEGEHFYYAVATDHGHNSLTREFDLTGVEYASLKYRIWYDLAKDDEYAYVTVSDDDGATWHTLSGIFMQLSELHPDFYPRGYTGSTANWLPESISLSAFTPGRILLRFEVVSSHGTTYGGIALDDVQIRAIDYQDGFESPDDAWDADGWIRTDNRLPNNTWLQVVQDTRAGLQVSRTLVSGNGDLTVDLLPGVSQVLVAVSPVVPQTSLQTDYELELYLMNAAGEIMVVTRDCTVTTTDVLNFRAAPNGNKIGLVPQGAALDALDHQGDWFMVEYGGQTGWIHADYVHTAGNCA